MPVTGKVVQGGQPVTGADVMFMPQGGAPSSGKTGADGRFELTFNDGRPGAIAGKHHVLISIPGPETPAPTGEEEAPVKATPTPEFHKDAEVQAAGENHFFFGGTRQHIPIRGQMAQRRHKTRPKKRPQPFRGLWMAPRS